MNKRFFAICLAAVAFAACSIHELDKAVPANEVFYAAFEDSSTRVFVNEDFRLRWNADDRVSIFDRDTDNRQYRFDGMDGDNSGSFSAVANSSSGDVTPLTYVYSVCPYNENTSMSTDGEITVCLPAGQAYKEDTFGSGANTMIAVAEDNVLMFKNLCGYLMLKLYGEDVSVKAITFMGNHGESLAGKALVSASLGDVPTLSMDASATKEITLTFATPVTIGTTAETATCFWLVVPPTTFEGGFAVTVDTSDGKRFKKSTTASLTISRNLLSKMSPLEVVPADPENHFLTFTSEGTTTLSLTNEGGNAPVLYYSTNKFDWTLWDYSELTFTSTQPLYICGDNPEGFNKRARVKSCFTTSGSNFRVSGDVMSLIDKDNEVTSIPCPFCFRDLFQGCSGLLSAPDLPATTLADGCYINMFSNCTSLTVAPALPASTLASSCYFGMFLGCVSLTSAPELPATTLTGSCYVNMFRDCISLTVAPALPATSLTENCYSGMFYGCTTLTTAPALPATTLAEGCYDRMFFGCTSLTAAPTLPAITLASDCYYLMFSGCTSLTAAPELPAATLAQYCYSGMFSGCTQLNYVKCLATDIRATDCVDMWLDGVADTGTFVKAYGMNDWTTGPSGIPEGWTVVDDMGTFTANKYLTFTSEGTTTVSLANELGNAPVLYYSTDKTSWTLWDYSELTFTSDQPLYLCGMNLDGFSTAQVKYSHFTTGGSKYRVSGDVMSLIDKEQEVTSIPVKYCFYRLFEGCTGLLSAPELSAEKLAISCYSYMFNGCTSLTTAPDLPAKTLAESCYYKMFLDCTGLTAAPELPATKLEKDCYRAMFSNTGLTTAPDLPAKTLAENCYKYMFYGCKKLNYVKCLATDISAAGCLDQWLEYVATAGTFEKVFGMADWISGASGIPEGWTIRDDAIVNKYLTFTSEGTTTMSLACEGGNDPVLYYSTDKTSWKLWDYSELTCTSDQPLYLCGMNPDGFSTAQAKYSHFTTGGSDFGVSGDVMSLIDKDQEVLYIPVKYCFYRLFEGCTGLISPPELSAKVLKLCCYSYMFSGCTTLTTAPDLPATTLAEACYYKMFMGCSNLMTAPELPATKLEKDCYRAMFSNTGLTTAPDLPAKTLAENCYMNMFYVCRQLNYVKCLATDISATGCTTDWLVGTSSSGTFVKAVEMEDWPGGTSGIPEGWTVQNEI